MKRNNFLPVLAITLSIFLTLIIGIAASAKDAKVQIHTIRGGKITEGQIRGWIDKANEIDKPHVKFVVDSNHVYDPNAPYDPNKNDPCRINIWGLPTKPWGNPNVSGAGGSTVWIVPGDGNAPGPEDPNGSGIFIKDSTLAHELNHLFGLGHSNDPNNKMYPDNRDHGDGTGVHSCHRKGTQITVTDANAIRDSNVAYSQDVMGNGRGGEVFDDPCDVTVKSIDLVWSQFWMEWIYGQYMLHFAAQVEEFSFFDFTEIGFYIADNDLATGEPPEGLDFYLAYRPQFGEITFKKYDSVFGWFQLPPQGITYDFVHAYPDSEDPEIPVGVEFKVPLYALAGMSGNFVSEKAVATNFAETDFAPNTGLMGYFFEPIPIPGDLDLNNKVDWKDLELLTYDWLATGGRRTDIYPDGKLNFSDFAVLANNWGAEIP